MSDAVITIEVNAQAVQALAQLLRVSRALSQMERQQRQLASAQNNLTRSTRRATGAFQRLREAGLNTLLTLGLVAGIRRVAEGIFNVGAGVLLTTSRFRALEAQLRFVGDSEKDFRALAAAVEDLKLLPGLTREEAASNLAQIRAFVSNTEDAATAVTAMQLAAVAGGRGAEEASGGINVMSQSIGKMQFEAEELGQLAERGMIPVLKIMNEQFGLNRGTTEQFTRAMQSLNLTMEDVWRMINNQVIVAVGDLAIEMSRTLPNAVSNFKSAWDRLKESLGEPFVDRATVFVAALTESIEGLEKSFEATRKASENAATKPQGAWQRFAAWTRGLDEALLRGMGWDRFIQRGEPALKANEERIRKAIKDAEKRAAAEEEMREQLRRQTEELAKESERRAIIKRQQKEELEAARMALDLQRARQAGVEAIAAAMLKQAQTQRRIDQANEDPNTELRFQLGLARIEDFKRREAEKAAEEQQRIRDKIKREQEKAQREAEAAAQKELRRLRAIASERVELAQINKRLMEAQEASQADLLRAEWEIIEARRQHATLLGDANANLKAQLEWQIALIEAEKERQRLAKEQAETEAARGDNRVRGARLWERWLQFLEKALGLERDIENTEARRIQSVQSILQLQLQAIDLRRQAAQLAEDPLADENAALAGFEARLEAEEEIERIREEGRQREMEAIKKQHEARIEAVRKFRDAMRDALKPPDIGRAVLGLGGADIGGLSAFAARQGGFSFAAQWQWANAMQTLMEDVEVGILRAEERARTTRYRFTI